MRGLLYSGVPVSRSCFSREELLVNINNNGTSGFSNFDNEFRVLRLLLMARWLEEYSITLKFLIMKGRRRKKKEDFP
jgi:hypothetical protein